jgi:hypothetical protein
MRRLGSFLVMMVFVIFAAVATSQTTGNSEPGFTLSISVFHRGGMPPNTHLLDVKTTNTSNVRSCETVRPNHSWKFNISVLLDGIPLEEKEGIQKIRKEGIPRGYGGFVQLWCTKPGESALEELNVTDFYDMSKPGTYEITVSRETDPDHPDKSVTVKSNTLTIVVPQPEAVAPK